MDDRSVISDRERRVEAEVEAEHRTAASAPDGDRDAEGGVGTDNDTTTATGARASDLPQGTVPGVQGVPGLDLPEEPAGDEDVEGGDRPGESYSPRSG